MIVDIHVHTRSPGFRYNAAEVEALKAYARRAGVERVVHLYDIAVTRDIELPDEGPPPEEVRASNDLVMAMVERHPDFITGFCFLNAANDPSFLLDEIERTVVNGNLSGIKLEAWVRATDPRLDPIMVRAAELNVPVLHHAFYSHQPFRNESNAAEIAHLARRHPSVTIIMAHLGGAGWRGVMDIKETPNVLVDTSGGPPCAQLIEYAVEQLGAERVIFGSDWPLRDISVAKARVMGANISAEAKDAIMGGNAARVLGLGGSTR